MLDFQGMMILAADQIWWTAEVENVFVKISQGEMRAMKDVRLLPKSRQTSGTIVSFAKNGID